MAKNNGKISHSTKECPKIELICTVLNVGSDEEIRMNQQFQSIIDVYLQKAVAGDKFAIALLHSAAVMAIKAMRNVEESCGAIVKQFAETRSDWPILLTTVPQQNASVLKSFEELELGSRGDSSYDESKVRKSEIEVKKIAWKLAQVIDGLRAYGNILANLQRLNTLPETKCAPSTEPQMRVLSSMLEAETRVQRALDELAHEFGTRSSLAEVDFLYFVIQSLRLPPLSLEGLKVWKKLAYEVFLFIADDEPQLNPKLKPLGTYRLGHSKSERADLRDGIKTRILQAFEHQVMLPKV